MRSCNYSLLGVLALFLSGSMASGQTFEISSQDQTHAAGSGAIPFTATFSIEQVTGALEDTKGFSFAYRHDDTLMEARRRYSTRTLKWGTHLSGSLSYFQIRKMYT